MKKAFTLAEVLITLGIIGIVAAMTMPILIGKYQEKQWQVAYKKAYSTFSQAFLQMKENGEFQDMTASVSEDGVLYTPAVGDNFKNISKYMKSIRTCFDSNADKCWVCDEGQSGHIYKGPPDWLGCTKTNYAFVDASGIAWFLYSNKENAIVLDVNGERKPNRLGQDRFVLQFGVNNSDDIYFQDANVIKPFEDKEIKGRWCPSGNCMYTTWLLK